MPRFIWTAVCLVLLGPPVLAQQGGPGRVGGTVRDSTGLPVESALVALDPNSNRRITRTDSDGHFAFDRVARGQHELTVVWIGYKTEIRMIDVADSGLTIDIVLHPNRTVLDTLRVVARRTGVHGTVFDRLTISPIPGADVNIVGANAQARTTLDGRFDLPQVRPGNYVVNVNRAGYESRMLSIIVPRDTAVGLALALDSGRSSSKRMSILLTEFDRRSRYMTRNNAAIVPRQELTAHRGQSLFDALRYSRSYLLKGLRLDDSVCVYVDGVFRPMMTAKDYGVADIESVEVYGSSSDNTNTVTWRSGQRPSRLPVGGICGRAEARTMMPRARRLGTPMQRSDPARVEAIVIWLKP
jgi:hypothetical protein